MDLIFDTPAIDLYDYGQDDGMRDCAYYWQEETSFLEELSPTPAYFA